jgi:hypothetical protein
VAAVPPAEGQSQGLGAVFVIWGCTFRDFAHLPMKGSTAASRRKMQRDNYIYFVVVEKAENTGFTAATKADHGTPERLGDPLARQ